MGDFKKTVKNKARVEGSICSAYLQHKTTYFCSHHFRNLSLAPRNNRNEGHGMNDSVQSTLSIFNQLGCPSDQHDVYWLTNKGFESAYVHDLINCNEVKPYLE